MNFEFNSVDHQGRFLEMMNKFGKLHSQNNCYDTEYGACCYILTSDYLFKKCYNYEYYYTIDEGEVGKPKLELIEEKENFSNTEKMLFDTAIHLYNNRSNIVNIREILQEIDEEQFTLFYNAILILRNQVPLNLLDDGAKIRKKYILNTRKHLFKMEINNFDNLIEIFDHTHPDNMIIGDIRFECNYIPSNEEFQSICKEFIEKYMTYVNLEEMHFSTSFEKLYKQYALYVNLIEFDEDEDIVFHWNEVLGNNILLSDIDGYTNKIIEYNYNLNFEEFKSECRNYINRHYPSVDFKKQLDDLDSWYVPENVLKVELDELKEIRKPAHGIGGSEMVVEEELGNLVILPRLFTDITKKLNTSHVREACLNFYRLQEEREV